MNVARRLRRRAMRVGHVLGDPAPSTGAVSSARTSAMGKPSVRILLLVENNSYPADFRVRREAHALCSAGYSVSVIAPRGAGQPWVEMLDDVAVYRFPAFGGARGVTGYAVEFVSATIAMLLLTGWVAARRGVDVVHAANPPDTLFAIGAVLKIFGKRFVFDHHDLAPETYLSRFSLSRPNLAYRLLSTLEYCTYAVADVVIVTNESYRNIAISRGRMDPAKVFVVRNGPPLSYTPLAGAALPAARKHCIGYVGTIGPQDGVDYWIRAIHVMVHTFGRSGFIAIVIGDGDALPACRQLARSLQIDSYVLFTGRLDETEARRWLSAADVCVQPDPSSPLNDKSTMNKLMEYMALGKPTVAFDLTETRFSAQGAAVYVTPNDEVAFAQEVCRLLDDPAARARMGEIGRARVVEALAWEHSVPALLAAYAALG